MAISYSFVTSDWKCVVERRGDDASAPLSFIIHKDGEAHQSTPLTTYEIGMLATKLARIYFERTNKVIWPVHGAMLAHYEKVGLEEAPEQVFLHAAASPGSEANRRAAEAPKEASCEFCVDECTGDCI
ncbi:hypothetical protein [Methylocystis hirsuta]|uniref:Uncharacterized protein n=1 Tax=Methylocystis hirsuta TaxID=369798 RepID=A0A3M9XMB4_9HYPH|nr:hypothetical protein [Methylocystis hirsuta]RNJ49429.1 hypothetical protein D1O30_07235 [Methylocystis hirsuta]